MKKKYAIVYMNYKYTVVDEILFESDDINEILNKFIEYLFSEREAKRLRVIEVFPIAISGSIRINNLGGERSASSEIR